MITIEFEQLEPSSPIQAEIIRIFFQNHPCWPQTALLYKATIPPTPPSQRRAFYNLVRRITTNLSPESRPSSHTCPGGLTLQKFPGSASQDIAHALEHFALITALHTLPDKNPSVSGATLATFTLLATNIPRQEKLLQRSVQESVQLANSILYPQR